MCDDFNTRDYKAQCLCATSSSSSPLPPPHSSPYKSTDTDLIHLHTCGGRRRRRSGRQDGRPSWAEGVCLSLFSLPSCCFATQWNSGADRQEEIPSRLKDWGRPRSSTFFFNVSVVFVFLNLFLSLFSSSLYLIWYSLYSYSKKRISWMRFYFHSHSLFLIGFEPVGAEWSEW